VCPGEHHVVLVLDAEEARTDAQDTAEEGTELEEASETIGSFGIRVRDFGPWPEGLSLRREDMYGDSGR